MITSSRGGGGLKNYKKGVEVWCAGLLKRGGGADTFPISFFRGLSSLHLEITLPFAKLCYAFLFFSVTIILCHLFVKKFKRLKLIFDRKQQLNW